MKPHIPCVALAVLSLAACSKKPAAGPSGESAQPKRNMSESLGLVSAEGPDSYSAPAPASPPPQAAAPQEPAPAPTPAPPAPAPVPAPVPAGAISRTLTAKDGRTVEALLLSRTATTVKIRRKADSAEFTIPLDRLSDADREFIAASSVPLTP